ncbi:chondroitin sulfate proteoglycan 5 [Corvus kubaryi]|uniref:chondroitin sulfate proteoglycan 5 n=1 Tax=Corvus kubaryi TaxID=68294 RepID=UPI001C04E2EE|nr:chondroitin sulfate proteoglycan 5 [Corvus kubaryi]
MEPVVQGQQRSSRCPTDGSRLRPQSSPGCSRVLLQHRHHTLRGWALGARGRRTPGARGHCEAGHVRALSLSRLFPGFIQTLLLALGSSPLPTPLPAPLPIGGASPWCPRGQVTGDRGRGGTWWQLDQSGTGKRIQGRGAPTRGAKRVQPGTGGLCLGGLSRHSPGWAGAPRCPRGGAGVRDPRPTGHRAAAPPPPPGVSGGSPTAWPRPGERGPPENGSECRSGYVRHNSSCRSLCDLVPSYCHNGGQCYLVESHGAFCRCNTQDYTWHKGTRCESIVTDFQVMCVAVGSAALVVLLLFMLTVFFAKKLYLLKTENSKLRKTKYRTPSELHNDNFSLSTIAEGSHPNDDPGAPHKLQDSLKSCLKDEEPFNIHNSTSPKHDGGKGEQDVGELNCLQNNLT